MTDRLIVIGGGISGITTALTLQLLGYETTIFAEYLVDEEAPEDPRLASLYPAASIIPHSVQTKKTDSLFPLSQQLFHLLWKRETKGLKLHKHYEIYEEKVNDPSYSKFLSNYIRIENQSIDSLPHRTKSTKINGWMFDCLVTEWPIYIQNLYKWYEKAGGTLKKQRILRSQLKDLDSDKIINCTGIWSSELFEDTGSCKVVKGHLLHVRDAPLISDNSGNIPSYNYTPVKNIYADPDGNATDVYFYPRSNGWVLGGSRLSGELDKMGNWKGKECIDTIKINGVDIPRQIYTLNESIIKNTFDVDLGRFSDIKAMAGYRFIRSFDENGLRLEKTKEHGKTVIHNYGHGGAGVSLSWGCALKVLEIIQEQVAGERVFRNLTTALTELI